MGGGASMVHEETHREYDAADTLNITARPATEPASPNSNVTRLRKAVYLELSPNKKLLGPLHLFFCRKDDSPTNFNALIGMYAFCILEKKSESEQRGGSIEMSLVAHSLYSSTAV